ncbi:MAG: hypothetical protein VX871_10300 [Pseudomonadota bacterium]|nr:hypothetical protein [Pseudomonadota bacterium]
MLSALLLAGCAVTHLSNPFGSSKPTKKNSWSTSVSEERLLDAAKTEGAGPIDVSVAGLTCPLINIWPRDRLITYYEGQATGDALAIRHRGEITKVARECSVQPDRVEVKYGIAGKVLLGPRGQPGVVTLPIVVYVTDRQRNIISTQPHKVTVTITDGDPVGYFSIVKDVTVAVPVGAVPGDYVVYVAFDQSASGRG